jgi:hypothetical protein
LPARPCDGRPASKRSPGAGRQSGGSREARERQVRLRSAAEGEAAGALVGAAVAPAVVRAGEQAAEEVHA